MMMKTSMKNWKDNWKKMKTETLLMRNYFKKWKIINVDQIISKDNIKNFMDKQKKRKRLVLINKKQIKKMRKSIKKVRKTLKMGPYMKVTQ